LSRLKVEAAASTLMPLGSDAVTLPIGAVVSGAEALHGVIMVIDMDMATDVDMAATAGVVAFVRGLARFGSARKTYLEVIAISLP
jgi:hypothetical protein